MSIEDLAKAVNLPLDNVTYMISFMKESMSEEEAINLYAETCEVN